MCRIQKQLRLRHVYLPQKTKVRYRLARQELWHELEVADTNLFGWGAGSDE